LKKEYVISFSDHQKDNDYFHFGMGRFINGRTNLEFMTWRNHFNRAKRTDSPILVNKEHIGPIPPGFEQQGFALNGVWGTYERKQGLETIRIRELPTQYHISVSNPIAENKSFTQLNLSRNQYGQTNPTTAQQKPSSVPHKASSASCFCGLSSVSKRLY